MSRALEAEDSPKGGRANVSIERVEKSTNGFHGDERKECLCLTDVPNVLGGLGVCRKAFLSCLI